MHLNKKKSYYHNRTTIILGAFISCFIGFYNNYPLVYPDTGTYIASGFFGNVPIDRTIFYGLFVRHISLSASPWLIIFAQGILSSWLLHTTFGMFFNGIKRNIVFLCALTFITLTTGYSYNVSILIPDIFCVIALICLLNLLFNTELSKLKTILISVVFIFSITTHLSNIPTYSLLLVIILCIFFIQKIRKKDVVLKLKKILLPIYLLSFTLLLIPTTNYMFSNKFYYSEGSHVFMVNHLIECGIMKKYLDENCENSDYKICEYKDSLSWNFIWAENSILYKTGGWEKNKDEYNEILFNIYSTPKYWPILTQKTIEYSVKQFFSFETTINPPQLTDSAPFGQINWHFHDSVREYLSSKQNNKQFNLGAITILERFVILISLVFIFIVTLYSSIFKEIGSDFKWISIIVLIYGIINSIICSNLSTVVPRYQNRWIWLTSVLTIIGLLLIYERIRGKVKNPKTTF